MLAMLVSVVLVPPAMARCWNDNAGSAGRNTRHHVRRVGVRRIANHYAGLCPRVGVSDALDLCCNSVVAGYLHVGVVELIVEP